MSKNTKSHWFWRYGYIAIVPVILLVVFLFGSDDRENQNNVNPEVFAFFKQVEETCQALSFDKQSDGCIKISIYEKDCLLITSKCNSLTFYSLLKKLDYPVPQYYKEGFIVK